MNSLKKKKPKGKLDSIMPDRRRKYLDGENSSVQDYEERQPELKKIKPIAKNV